MLLPGPLPRVGMVGALFLLAARLTAPAAFAATGAIEGYEWMGGVNEGTASFTYGSPESIEGLEFRLTCEPKTKGQGLNVKPVVELFKGKASRPSRPASSQGRAKALA